MPAVDDVHDGMVQRGSTHTPSFSPMISSDHDKAAAAALQEIMLRGTSQVEREGAQGRGATTL